MHTDGRASAETASRSRTSWKLCSSASSGTGGRGTRSRSGTGCETGFPCADATARFFGTGSRSASAASSGGNAPQSTLCLLTIESSCACERPTSEPACAPAPASPAAAATPVLASLISMQRNSLTRARSSMSLDS
eukprot:Amastigsp_a174552_42.p4 type:complete len:135 gc:universal Amastigsp_a174552_42:941-1345(+)